MSILKRAELGGKVIISESLLQCPQCGYKDIGDVRKCPKCGAEMIIQQKSADQDTDESSD